MIAFFGLLFIELLLFAVFYLWLMSWNIPVTLLRYTGNKGRPLIFQTKAKKIIKNGIPRLYVKGYPDPIRDYLAENYYPSPRSKYGGLILWEFEDGLLTPALPKKELNKLTPEQKKEYDQALNTLKAKAVSFSFDEQLYKDLKLKVVDDVDQEFALQEMLRTDNQYNGGWKEFLMKYGGHATVIIIAILMLVGVILWFDKMPEFAAQCAGTAQSIVNDNIARQAAAALTPAG